MTSAPRDQFMWNPAIKWDRTPPQVMKKQVFMKQLFMKQLKEVGSGN